MRHDASQNNSNNFHEITNNKAFSICLSTFFAFLLLIPLFLLLFTDQPSFSEDENRMLATVPSFSGDALLGGSYTARLSDYFRDHLPARSTLLKCKALTEYALLKGENNHVVIGKNSHLIKRFSYTDEQLATFRKNVTAVAELQAALSNTEHPALFVCAPRAVDVLAESYAPRLAEPSERSVWNVVEAASPNAVTLQALLKEKAERGEPVWFRTDHHWTPLGAYYVYRSLGDALGYQPLPRDAFKEVTVSHSFLGTSYSACQFPLIRPDTITAFRFSDDTNFTRTDVLTGQSRQGLYDEEKLLQKDQYQYFLGGNTAHLRIEKPGTTGRKTLLVIKDSYAQALVPFLARHFDIELIDLRYFRTDATETLLAITKSPDYGGALILINADTLTGDAGLGRVSPDKLH